jgi:hypothetical protein
LFIGVNFSSRKMDIEAGEATIYNSFGTVAWSRTLA